jgi:hypothetical protein
MKKLILLAILLVSTANFAQKKRSPNAVAVKTNTADSTSTVKTEWKNYIAVSVSMSSGNTYDTNENKYTFSESAYPSVEFGFSKGNLMAGLAVGRGSFKGMTTKEDKIGNYYAEIRVTPSFPLGIIDANVVFGAGSYLVETKGFFIEYGSGISYTHGDYTYGIGYSNWDGVDYISPSLSYSF